MGFPAPRTAFRAATVIIVQCAVLLPTAPGAHAADGGGSVGNDSITAEVRDGAPRDSQVCQWRPVTGVDPASGSVTERPVTRTVNGARETLYQRSCPRPSGGDSWYQWVRESTTNRVVNRAEDSVTERVTRFLFHTAPPADRNVVNVGTWFWVPKATWKPVSATAHVVLPYGAFSVTVTATPSRLRFEPGDGSDPVWCTGPGRPWSTRLGDDEPSDCMHTYRHASDDRPRGRFDARTSVQWNVRVSSNFGLGFPLPPLTLGLATPVTVKELQAVLSS